MDAYEKAGVQFVIAARKTACAGATESSGVETVADANADGQCEFRYQAGGWSKEYRFIALRYAKNILFPDASERAEWTHSLANLVFLTRRADQYARHYFVYSLVMTPLIRLMLDTGRATDRSVLFERFWATLIGSGLVLSTGMAVSQLRTRQGAR